MVLWLLTLVDQSEPVAEPYDEVRAAGDAGESRAAKGVAALLLRVDVTRCGRLCSVRIVYAASSPPSKVLEVLTTKPRSQNVLVGASSTAGV